LDIVKVSKMMMMKATHYYKEVHFSPQVKKRILNSPPKIELQPREQVLQEIRSQPKLRPVRERKIGKGG
jgi:hypothetical protein